MISGASSPFQALSGLSNLTFISTNHFCDEWEDVNKREAIPRKVWITVISNTRLVVCRREQAILGAGN